MQRGGHATQQLSRISAGFSNYYNNSKDSSITTISTKSHSLNRPKLSVTSFIITAQKLENELAPCCAHRLKQPSRILVVCTEYQEAVYIDMRYLKMRLVASTCPFSMLFLGNHEVGKQRRRYLLQSMLHRLASQKPAGS
jgi:hypothetical protein